MVDGAHRHTPSSHVLTFVLAVRFTEKFQQAPPSTGVVAVAGLEWKREWLSL